jgi:hypothetical protein
VKIFIFLFLFALSISGEVLIFSGKGKIPPEVNATALEHQFHQILHSLDSTRLEPHQSPVYIIFYDPSEYRQHGIRLPEWGGGGAIGTDSIVIPINKKSAFYDRNLNKIILHELVHISISRLFGKTRVPRWFHEGTAMALSGEISIDEQVILSRAILSRKLLPLDSIEFLNRFDHWKASLGYSQSHAVTMFLIDTYGIDLIPELIIASRKTRRFEDACVETFGLTIKEVELLFVKEMKVRYPLFMLFSDVSLFWILIIVLSAIAWIVVQARKKKRTAEMEREESTIVEPETEEVDSGTEDERPDLPDSNRVI